VPFQIVASASNGTIGTN